MTAKIKLNAASGGGSFSLQAPSSSANNRVMTLPDSADGTILTTTNPKAGNIIQVVQTVKSDTTSTTSQTFGDISGLSVNITPSSSSSKILFIADVAIGGDNNTTHSFKLLRGSTDIYIADTASNRIRASGAFGHNYTYGYSQVTKTFLDSPSSTSQQTYKVQWRVGYAGTMYLNRSHQDRDNANFEARLVSSLTVMEVAA